MHYLLQGWMYERLSNAPQASRSSGYMVGRNIAGHIIAGGNIAGDCIVSFVRLSFVALR